MLDISCPSMIPLLKQLGGVNMPLKPASYPGIIGGPVIICGGEYTFAFITEGLNKELDMPVMPGVKVAEAIDIVWVSDDFVDEG